VSDNREQGIAFGRLQERLEAEDYPISNDALLEKHGDERLSHANGSETLHDILVPLDDEYESAEEVRQAIFTMIGEEAEGRKGYTDRESNARSEDYEQQSF